ncbi:hypothetical protein BZG36_02472 [Bifiguratus adelaidae]|uniref:tRNA/rRNA methyltransferase SpoU type domain-containing protein n=1 Tax=Bifiguratus adelaidae TaxID=1938954 RepID=A0A261Y0X4_9FUNG|nr:hypothetical protein BZG36_02472 [Bifiguratus adelaidae]
MSGNRPHQGVVLEASPLKTVELSHLSFVDSEGRYTLEGIGESRQSTKPLWLAMDQIQDPHNLGSILRTSYFLGIDGVIVSSKNSAPLSPTVSKVSAGAMELMPVYSAKNLVNFLSASKEAGWSIIGASALSSPSKGIIHVDKEHHPIPFPTHARILVVGNEGKGLRTHIHRLCTSIASIQGNPIINSLNVGVATAILLQAIH